MRTFLRRVLTGLRILFLLFVLLMVVLALVSTNSAVCM